MKIRFRAATTKYGSEVVDTFDLLEEIGVTPDEWEAMSEDEREENILILYTGWLQSVTSGGWEIIEGNDEPS